MRTIAVIVFCLLTGDLLGQHKLNPVCFLNSDTIDIENVYIHPSSITAVNVDKKTERGEIHITTKGSLTFLSLDMILQKYSDLKESTGSIAYSINNKVVVDKAQVKVDDSFFIQVNVKRFDEVMYIQEEHRNLILVDIQLFNERTEPKIMIRGEGLARATN